MLKHCCTLQHSITDSQAPSAMRSSSQSASSGSRAGAGSAFVRDATPAPRALPNRRPKFVVESDPSVPPGRWGDSEWHSWNGAEYNSDADWGTQWNDTGSQQAELEPQVAAQWNQSIGMQRLQNLDLCEKPGLYPDDMGENPWALHTFMESTHMALSGMRDEALIDCEKRYTSNYTHLTKIHPTWMTLEPPTDLRIWAPILGEQQIDNYAITDLREVIESGGHGYYEGIRIIAHLLKDTEHPAWRNGPAAWLHNATAESLNATSNWKEWDCQYNGKQSSWPSRAASTSATLPTATRSDWSDYTRVTRGVR